MSGPLFHQPATPDIDSKDVENDFDQQDFNELDNISPREILDQDSRPTFVLDLDSDYLDYGSTRHGIRPIFCNAALRFHDRLLESITGSRREALTDASDDTKYHEFRSW